MKLSDFETGLRILDIEHGLRGFQPSGLIQAELANTLVLGKAANLALHIRGLNVVGKDDVKGLTVLAAELGISYTELLAVLRELDELGWVRLHEHTGKIQRVEVNVPTLRLGFDEIGARFRNVDPSELEKGSIIALSDAIMRPFSEHDLTDRLDIDPQIAKHIVEVGAQGAYLQPHRLDDGETILFSPLYCEKNPEKAYEVAQHYGDKALSELVTTVRAGQGIPLPKIVNQGLVKNAVVAGLLAAPAVNEKQFVFTNQKGIADEESTILEEARAIISCVRYGQNYASITKVKYPRLIIDRLISQKSLSPHSEHLHQYGLLMKRGIARIEKVGSRYRLSIVDTDDNMRALRVARDLLETGEGVHQSVDEGAQIKLFDLDGSYSTTVVERAKLTHAPRKSAATNKRELDLIADLVRGARSE